MSSSDKGIIKNYSSLDSKDKNKAIILSSDEVVCLRENKISKWADISDV